MKNLIKLKVTWSKRNRNRGTSTAPSSQLSTHLLTPQSHRRREAPSDNR